MTGNTVIRLTAVFLSAILFTFNTYSQRRNPDAPPIGYDVHKLMQKWNPAFQSIGFTETSFFIKVNGGTDSLDVTRCVPLGTPPSWPPGGWPVIVFIHGLGGDKLETIPSGRLYADYGYYTMCISVRGQGLSSGTVNLLSMTEAQDLFSIVSWIKADVSHQANKDRIALTGGSQGGTLPWMAAANGLNVQVICPNVTNPNFASLWVMNGAVKMSLVWGLLFDNAGNPLKLSPGVARMLDWIYSGQVDKLDSIKNYMPVGRDFSSQIANVTTPIVNTVAWQDYFFPVNGAITAYNQMTSFHKLYMGTGGHGSDGVQEQWNFQFDWNTKAFDYFLRDYANGINTTPNVAYAYSKLPITDPVLNTFTWSSVDNTLNSWPPPGTNNVRYYFNASNNTLQKTLPTSTTGSKVLANPYLNTSYTMRDAIEDGFSGTEFNAAFKKRTIAFTSGTLTTSMRLAGVPKFNVYARSNAVGYQLNFQIYEQTPAGKKYFITRGNYNNTQTPASVIANLNFEGQARAHQFAAGNRIRIEITNFDNPPNDWFLDFTNPFVLPVFKNASTTIFMRQSMPSYIDLPMITVTSDVADNSQSITPNKFALMQNYPNPFNPKTNISYSVKRETSNVKLIVYDIVGKEIAILVNAKQDAGAYEVEFDGSNFASGIYFYKLEAGSFIETKKMILIK